MSFNVNAATYNKNKTYNSGEEHITFVPLVKYFLPPKKLPVGSAIYQLSPEKSQAEQSQVSREQILQVYYAKYRAKVSKSINILLVGRSQSGKSTLLETLLNPLQAVKGTGYSVTREPEVRAFVLHDERHNNFFNVNVIDTPGLNEVRIDEKQSRADEEIIKLARHCIANQITFLNAVIYVARGGQAHELDIEAFSKIKKFLGDKFGGCSLMVLSHCEDVIKTKFEEIVTNMKKYDKTKEMIEYCGLGILPYGTMSASRLEALLDEEGDDDDDEDEEENQGKDESENQGKDESKYMEESIRKLIIKTLKRTSKMRQNLLAKIIETAGKPNYISELDGHIQFIKSQEQKAIDKALGEKTEEWEKKLSEKLNNYEKKYSAMQETVAQEYKTEFKATTSRLFEQYQEELKKQINEEKSKYESLVAKEREILRNEYNTQLSNIIKDKKEQQEKARLFAEKQAKEATERERKIQEEMEKQRLEREKQRRAQEIKEAEAREKRLAAEQECRRLREVAEHETRLRKAAEENTFDCSVM